MTPSPDVEQLVEVRDPNGNVLFSIGAYAAIEHDPYSMGGDIIYTTLTQGLSMKSPDAVLATYIDGFRGDGYENRRWGKAEYIIVLLPEVGEPFFITMGKTRPGLFSLPKRWMKLIHGDIVKDISPDHFDGLIFLLELARDATVNSDQGARHTPRAMLGALGVPAG